MYVKHNSWYLLGILAACGAQACAGANVVGGDEGGSGAGQGGPGAGGGGGGSHVVVNLDAAFAGQPDTRSGEPPPDLTGYQCDDAGNCTKCQPVRIVSIGQPATYGSGSNDSTKAFEKMKSFLVANPDVGGVWAANDNMALGALEALSLIHI